MLQVDGLEILPPAPLFFAFVIAGLALNFVPGADMTYVIASSARSGIRAGIAATVGIFAGTFIHIVLAVVGISALIASSPMMFDALKWIGAAYLVYLAIQLMRSSPADSSAPHVHSAVGAAFRGGVLVNAFNPKVALFFVAFLPQFVDPHTQSRTLQLVALGLWFNTVGTVVNLGIAIVASRAATKAREFPWLAAFARWFAALAFIGLAIRLVLANDADARVGRRALRT